MEELKRIREERGMSQTELAAVSGVDRATINQVEGGRRSPTIATLEKLADALGIQVAEFFPLAQPPLPFGSPVKGPDPEEWDPDEERPRWEPPRPGGQAHSRNVHDAISVDDTVTTRIAEAARIIQAWKVGTITPEEADRELEEIYAA